MKIKAPGGQEISLATKQAVVEAEARVNQQFVGDMMARGAGGSASDRVSLGLGRSILQELTDGAVDPERSARLAKLKEQIAAGDYNPSPELIAEAVARDISLEILSSGRPDRSRDDE